MKICYLVILQALQLVLSYNCTDYDLYRKDFKRFFHKCGSRPTLSFGRTISPLIDARRFRGDEFNWFFSRLKKFQVCIRIRNTSLRRVVFPAIRRKAAARCSKYFAAIVILDNPLLEEIVFGNGTVLSKFVPTLLVRGNRKLSKESIERMNKIKRGFKISIRTSIQTAGECPVPKPLENLDDLIGCESLFGDILLEDETLKPPSEPLKAFNHTGCVIVKDSNVENINFLYNLRNNTVPPWLCDSELTCMGGIVTPDYIASTIANQKCDIIREDVILQNWTDDSTALQHFKSVRKIIGVLHVSDCPELVTLDFFSNLQEIDAGAEDERAALVIANNSALQELRLASLRSVKSNASLAIIIDDNPMLRTDFNEWYELAGGQNRSKLFMIESEVEEQSHGSLSLPIVLAPTISFLIVLMLLIYCCSIKTKWKKFSGMSTHVGSVAAK
ncbi:receptor L domain protein [Dictyocaulus viviparus]|uniref:Receptor L domain protein n=1 Tax=Dictyocaulus viviparus TaxID=29172 RepID=A0A0D8YCK7_DICVI|nr:receptor L domain protein [Dictyocaulus viviparus]